jgi:bacteriocin biosynthesis cyclodehydratase domain-containing protein
VNQLRDPAWRLVHPAVLTWRGPHTLQIGLQPPITLLEGVPARIADALALLAEPHTKADLVGRLPDLAPAWIDWLCAHLSSTGFLIDAPPSPAAEVVVLGQGQLARSLTASLGEVGILAQRRPPGPMAGHYGQHLVILADAQVEPDRALTTQLTSSATPHLVVRLEPSRAVVGPLVVPGQTACVRCDDLGRCHLDSHWPMVLAQLCSTSTTPDPGLLGWAVATALAQVRAWLARAEPESLGRCLELGLADFRLRSRTWPAQPACGCSTAGTTDTAAA